MRIIKLYKIRIRAVFNIFTALCFILACNKASTKDFNSNLAINIQLDNTKHIDLLNPENPGNYNSENIKIFYTKNGKLTEYSERSIKTPHGYTIEFNDNKWSLILTPIKNQDHEFATTFIKWNCIETDTINFSSIGSDNRTLIITK